MLKSKYFLKGLVIVITLLFFFGFKEQFEKLFIKYTGHKILAIVTEVPLSCDRYNHIKVSFENTETEISISNSNCRRGKYRVGQEVELLKHNKLKTPVWPESQPEIAIVILLCLVIYIFFQYRKLSILHKKGLPVSR